MSSSSKGGGGGGGGKEVNWMQKDLQSMNDQLRQNPGDKPGVDLVFVIDTTSSMAPWIDRVKKDIIAIRDEIKRKTGGRPRVALVGYKDFCDAGGAPLGHVTSHDFDKDTATFLARANGATLQASGGGDAAEDAIGGLSALCDLSWTRGARVAVLVTDAPQHGAQFHNLGRGGDHHHDTPHPDQQDPAATLRQLSKLGIDLTVIQCGASATTKMCAEFRQMYAYPASDSTSVSRMSKVQKRHGRPGEFRATVELGSDYTRLMPEVLASVTKAYETSSRRSASTLTPHKTLTPRLSASSSSKRSTASRGGGAAPPPSYASSSSAASRARRRSGTRGSEPRLPMPPAP